MQGQDTIAQTSGARHRVNPNHLIIRPKSGNPESGLSQLRAKHGHRLIRAFPDSGNLQVLELQPGEEIAGALLKYRESGLVEFAEPDYIVHVTDLPNDPSFSLGSQWSLNNIGQNGGLAGADIHAKAAWDIMNSASNIIVAVVDSGVRYTHEDLADNMWNNPGETAGNGLDDDGDGIIDDVHGFNAITGDGDPYDENGHGTHVAGIIGAVGNNGKGISGVAWKVQIMACKFLNATGDGDTSAAISCIDYARKKGAKIINASWGGSEFSFALQTAIAAARQAGIIFVAAAGNEGSDNDLTPEYPASYASDNIVSVAATTRNDTLDTAFSNFGATTVHLAAPGSAIYSTWFGSDSSYTYLSGTSMAAPCVSGVLALMCSRFSGESYSQIIARLLASTDPLPTLAGKCVTGGRVNLERALGPALLADFAATPLLGSVPLTVHLTENSLGTILSRTWDFGDGSPLSLDQNPIHMYTNAGNFTITLTITGTNGMISSKTRTVSAVANYGISSSTFNWIDPTGMTQVPLSDNGVAGPHTLPFTFNFYGHEYNEIYIGANGLLGFTNQNLQTTTISALPNAAAPNAMICPYWDNLNGALGKVWIGTIGDSPHRSTVVSWVGLPRNSTPTIAMSFQAILRESSDEIEFQYLEVHPENSRGGGRRASIGIENEAGLIGAKYTFNGAPATLTNQQAILFSPGPRSGMSVSPESNLDATEPKAGPFVPVTQTYTLKNQGNTPMTWAASNVQSWTTLSAIGGLLGAGETTNIDISINDSALALALGAYADTISFLNLNNGNGNKTRAVTLAIEGSSSILEVSPDSPFSSSGPAGGPFNPGTQIYTLLNSGDATLQWSSTQSQPWIGLAPTNGLLRPGQTATLVVSLNDLALNLPVTNYTAEFLISNQTSGVGNASRTVSLNIQGLVSSSATPFLVAFPGFVRLKGELGQVYIIQASTNLLDWLPVFTNTPAADGTLDFYDSDMLLFSKRFYRGATSR